MKLNENIPLDFKKNWKFFPMLPNTMLPVPPAEFPAKEIKEKSATRQQVVSAMPLVQMEDVFPF